MKKLLLILIFCQFIFAGYTQEIASDKKFTEITTQNNKIVFLKDFPMQEGQSSDDATFEKIKAWGKKTYGDDPFNSNIRYDNKNKEIRIISKIELVLPENTEGVRETVQMRYKANVFLIQNKCVLEIRSIAYFIGTSKKKKACKGEDVLFTQSANTSFSNEFRENLKKSTLFFLNELADGVGASLKN